MRTTTVVWVPTGTFDPDAARVRTQQMNNYAVELAGELFEADLETTYNEERTSFTVKRAWPDEATAQAWVTFVLNEGAASAQVDPE